MKQILSAIIVSLFLISADVKAQTIPQSALDTMINKYLVQGCKLDKSFLPQMKRFHPNNLMLYNKCYPGKKVIMMCLVAKKPSDWKMKFSYGSQVAAKDHQISPTTIDGVTYWTDWIVTRFPAGLSDPSEYCTTMLAYDGDAIDLPIYTYIFIKDM